MKNFALALCALLLSTIATAQGNPASVVCTPGDQGLVQSGGDVLVLMNAADDDWPFWQLEVVTVTNGLASTDPNYKSFTKTIWPPDYPFSHRQFNVTIPAAWGVGRAILTTTLTADSFMFTII